MMNKLRCLMKSIIYSVPLVVAGIHPAYGAPVSSADYTAVPPILSKQQTPLVMLAMSNDHQLYFKAYSDYDDLDGDGNIDTTYKHDFDYYGYFDTGKCYAYSSGSGVFQPKSVTANKYCGGTQWSGNFLNWATMARMDTIRKLLYGGLRSTDTASATVLERTFIPNDAHSFAKLYSGSDLNKLTPIAAGKTVTFCNTTVNNTSASSQNVTDAPLLRVAEGDYSLWAGNERWQCRWSNEKSASNGNDSAKSGLSAANSNPGIADSTINSDYKVRVEVCVSEALKEDNCKEYPDGNLKPIGVLQTYGDDDSVRFGLMTGSYGKNKSGGVLRKNIGVMSDEVNISTDGTFKSAPAAGSVIGTMNALRLYGYTYSQGYYNSGDNCGFQLSSFSNGNCSNWGNPVAEILAECYAYFGNKGANSAFNTDDSSYISTLKTATWADPIATDNACANLSVIMFNASTVSYDSDELTKYETDFLSGTETAVALTNTIGAAESIHGNDYFVGENGTDNNQLCTPKTINELGKVEGTCPGAPRLDGSYKMAGIAYHAHTNDLRAESDRVGAQTVTTYGVALSPGLPAVNIPVPGKTDQVVNLLPACRNDKPSPSGNCAIVDFKIVNAYAEDASTPGTYKGKLYVNWEDSEQGGDFDQDMWGTIDYEITSTTIKVITDVHAESTSGNMGFGYVLGGTTKDGFHVHSGIEGFNYTESDASLLGCSNCNVNDAATSNTYTIGTATAKLLETPLYYASKWGGFTDIDGNDKPDSPAEWDIKDNRTGDFKSDGIPDNYFLSTNPSQLEDQLEQVLKSIVSKTASGTNAAVVSNSSSGVGAVYQALYQPALAAGANSVSWVGRMHALFIDSKGNLREDNGDYTLGSYTDDPVVTIEYVDTDAETVVFRWETTDGETFDNLKRTKHSLSDLSSIWSAENALASVADVTANRSYSSKAESGRYIFTAVDGADDGVINQDDVISFEESQFDGSFALTYNDYLGISDLSTAANLVKWIRGAEVTGYRNREYDIDADGSIEVWRLGDIVHSTPAVVGAPADAYHIKYGDDSYRAFYNHYLNRRQMIYVGANDGMLHGFNGGFWDPTNQKFSTSDGASATQTHSIGSELWAYIPMNLLPHLRWLPETTYPHVYYMDGEPITFDANIFSADTDHPGGWGTVMVATMRLGGGSISVDVDPDGDGSAVTKGMNSAIVIFDITNPEKEPKLLGEFTDDNLGFTTSRPTVIKKRAPSALGDWSSPLVNEWYLAFGSGPHGSEALSKANSDQSTHTYLLDLKKVVANVGAVSLDDPHLLKTGTSPGVAIDSGISGFSGDFTSVDWDKDFQDDNIYFGTVNGSTTPYSGKLKRVDTSSIATLSVTNLLDDVNKPILAAPLAKLGSGLERWLMVGTGRMLVAADNLTTAQQQFYGVKEPKDASGAFSNAAVSVSSLVDTSDIAVFSDGSIKQISSGSLIDYVLSGTTITTYDGLKSELRSSPGWKINLENSGTAPTGRVTRSAASIFNIILFTEYLPPAEACDVDGSSYLWALDFEGGISTPFIPLAQSSTVKNAGDLYASENKVYLGSGQASSPVVHQGADGTVKVITNLSTGEIEVKNLNVGVPPSGRQSWKQIDITNF